MLQVPNIPNYQLAQPSYNAVKIDIHNPTVGGATCPTQMAQPQAATQAQYAAPTAPLYAYPQTPIYNYPQAAQQPYYQPAQQIDYATQAQAQAQAIAQAQAQAQAAAQAAAQAQAQVQAMSQASQQCPPCNAATAVTAATAAQAAAPVQQINVNQAPKAPEPVATNAAAAATATATANATTEANVANQPAVEVQAPTQAAKPQVDLNNFLARLTNPDFEVQANAMEEIANMVKDEPQKATELLDTKVMDALINIINTESGKLSGPTQEQINARQKLMNGQQISDADKTLATTITPMEQAERNKSYAMYTTAILQKLYKDEVAKLTGSTVPLTELPAAIAIVDNLKDNPNPMVRASAIEALSYIQAPEYKKDLNTLFTVAQNDQDNGVREAAKAALEKLSTI